MNLGVQIDDKRRNSQVAFDGDDSFFVAYSTNKKALKASQDSRWSGAWLGV
jgi:hypothetical protein